MQYNIFRPLRYSINKFYITCKSDLKFVHQSKYLVHTTKRSFVEEKCKVLVYEGPLKKRMKFVKILSLASSLTAASMLPIVLKDLSQISIALAFGGGIISMFFLSTPLILHWITKRYVLQLNFNSETKIFTAKTYNLLTQEKDMHFRAEEVTVPEVPGMLSSFVVRNNQLFVDYRLVQDADAYSHMMGYDKPINFQLKGEEKQDKK